MKSLLNLGASEKHNFFCQWYFLKIDKELEYFTIQQEEVEKIKWFKKTELEKELELNPDKFLASTSDILNKFRNS